MQIKVKKDKVQITIENAKITGMTGNDINFLNNINESIYKAEEDIYYTPKYNPKSIGLISIKEAYDNIFGNVKEFILSDSVKYNVNAYELDDILKMVGISKKLLVKDISHISTSEKILAIFAKVLLYNPDTLLIDNVLCKLDSKSRDKIIKFLIKLKKFEGKTIVISSVDIDIIYEFIDDLIIFNDNDFIIESDKYSAYDSDPNNLKKPLVVEITDKVFKKSGINLGNNDSINELIKAIYREIR